mmetsp:Transcript_129885/g.361912  ORF Transcript_129885/g.361912 Transcript_129885/m.361912 type:complete len:352 (+) Transcript_129885:88-1143(+)|eukprot:CAMPEP_0179024154 /NCGR_PEP_ID=MMETSP0796-20121207/7309_1 /TAXON_ID=73915 /ORGANISM="Pyrodinium bahamense, Strain pbaha01" /LENGTH=351 /DNA_ID=CAMNT_0020720107 /DNA_START=83 /DNA_END=1138 /DNA_ORIENTATION=+
MPWFSTSPRKSSKGSGSQKDVSTESSEHAERPQKDRKDSHDTLAGHRDFDDGRSQVSRSTCSTPSRLELHDYDLRHVFEDRTLPLVKVSAPTPVGLKKVRYCVHIQRASLKQPFGVTFNAATTSDDQCQAISVAEDLPHLGLGRSDRLLAINGTRPKEVSECMKILGEAMSLVLIMQHGEVHNADAKDGTCACCTEPPDSFFLTPKTERVTLSVTRPMITDEARGEFQLSIHRVSLKQKFGLNFMAEHPRGSGGAPVILVSEDMPHVALTKGDRLVSVNSVSPRSVTECQQVLARSMTIQLVLKRHPHRLANLTPLLDPLGAEVDSTSETIAEVPIQQEKSQGRHCMLNLC